MGSAMKKKIDAGAVFLLFVLVAYLAAAFIDAAAVKESVLFFLSILKKIVFIFILIFVLMVLTNYFIKPKKLAKYLGENAGAKGWVISIIGGIISTGAIYMWYPLLKELKKKGMKTSYIAAFLYNRAIKLHLLPLLILYFGLVYTIVLTIVMIIISIFQGIIVEKLVG